MATITLGTLRDYWKNVSDWVKGTDAVSKPKVAAQITDNKMELYGASLDDRPDATTVPIGATFTIVDDTHDFKTWMSNGVDWGEEI